MPSQVDPKVLAELPEDIRSKLLRQGRQSSPTPTTRNSLKGNRGALPTGEAPIALTALPAHSQLDPEILAALPPDVRAEVLSQYTTSTSSRSPYGQSKHIGQTTLPQSPRKNRTANISAKKPVVAPTKRGRGRPPKSAQSAAAPAANAKDKSGKTLTQANFISLKNPARGSRESSVDPGPTGEANADSIEDLDPDFLSALPEDLRKEVIEEHKRKKLQASRLALHKSRKAAPPPLPQTPRPAQTLKVPRPPKPTFTVQKFCMEGDLRKAMKEWVKEFAEEGPYNEDTGALDKYLRRVVKEERDLGKAVGMVRWLEWIVSDLSDEEKKFDRCKWEEAVRKVKDGVREAAKGRGLGEVTFD